MNPYYNAYNQAIASINKRVNGNREVPKIVAPKTPKWIHKTIALNPVASKPKRANYIYRYDSWDEFKVRYFNLTSDNLVPDFDRAQIVSYFFDTDEEKVIEETNNKYNKDDIHLTLTLWIFNREKTRIDNAVLRRIDSTEIADIAALLNASNNSIDNQFEAIQPKEKGFTLRLGKISIRTTIQ